MTPSLRGIESAHPGRFSFERNVETPSGSGNSRPTVRKAEPPGGKRRPEKRMPAAERRREFITGWIGLCPRRKPADAGLVSYPKDAVRVAKRRTS